MKLIKENTGPALTIPAAVMEMSGLAKTKRMEIHSLDHAAVVLKCRMTAMELIKTIESLKNFTTELTVHLTKVCGSCQDCENCSVDFSDDYSGDEIRIPNELLDEAGIPRDAKLAAYADRDDGSVTIVRVDYEFDLSDVPQDLLDIFISSGICLAELEEHLMTEDVVYGD
jgi:antitoxin component of MazEF toxin-antitoxin module